MSYCVSGSDVSEDSSKISGFIHSQDNLKKFAYYAETEIPHFVIPVLKTLGEHVPMLEVLQIHDIEFNKPLIEHLIAALDKFKNLKN